MYSQAANGQAAFFNICPMREQKSCGRDPSASLRAGGARPSTAKTDRFYWVVEGHVSLVLNLSNGSWPSFSGLLQLIRVSPLGLNRGFQAELAAGVGDVGPLPENRSAFRAGEERIKTRKDIGMHEGAD